MTDTQAALPDANLRRIHTEVASLLDEGIVPFWSSRAVDAEHGGYLTEFDADGNLGANSKKYLITQARMIWAFSAFAQHRPADAGSLLEQALQGVDFLRKNFWDEAYGGFRWSTTRDGKPLDPAKTLYAQSFAIYGLSMYASVSGDTQALELAEATFDLCHVIAADILNGGYHENFSQDWHPEGPGKSLDVHLHMMESFSQLAKVTGSQKHRRRLRETVRLISSRFVDKDSGAGRNQTTDDFLPQRTAPVAHTWGAERAGEHRETQDVTSYGHNLELCWLLGAAAEVLGEPVDDRIRARLGEHALAYGLDPIYGGIFREGPHQGAATDQDKEWWQQAEALVGFLDCYELTGDTRYLDAFVSVWNFTQEHLIAPDVGEWRMLASRDGTILNDTIGSVWKGAYHSGRSALETIARLDRIIT
ncbi:AGE family epimerase/isomerase [Streptomyces sp. NPDC051776]|uniref:AGE family epimerase/isomerase n=1 Tax=Streptomyces sp. NPDC051776 TaxID=3155414 RepID=UPI003432C460